MRIARVCIKLKPKVKVQAKLVQARASDRSTIIKHRGGAFQLINSGTSRAGRRPSRAGCRRSSSSRTSTSTAAAYRPCPATGSRSCRRWRTRWSATTRGRWVRSNCYEMHVVGSRRWVPANGLGERAMSSTYAGCGASGSRLMPCSWNISRMPSARHLLSRVSGWSSPKSRRELAYASS